ncbi:hypothetical protein [Nevskia soli]|uniref:hypothetical protein n=1 Tax=Nevskia soli TaxID=418856 RepID=UPI0015D94C07|nr:hypothetical protein [Nevskia soli]
MCAALLLFSLSSAQAQRISVSPDRPWQPPPGFSSEQQHAADRDPRTPIDPRHQYSLPELIDLAERHSPTTRAAWENARAAGML